MRPCPHCCIVCNREEITLLTGHRSRVVTDCPLLQNSREWRSMDHIWWGEGSSIQSTSSDKVDLKVCFYPQKYFSLEVLITGRPIVEGYTVGGCMCNHVSVTTPPVALTAEICPHLGRLLLHLKDFLKNGIYMAIPSSLCEVP